MTVRVRLAPSPTGKLHIGTARTALYNWLFASNQGGKFLLRIEDTDKERSKPEFTQNILDGLKWLGLKWDEEPVLQSERIDNHKAAIQELLTNGLAYRCYATEEELTEMRENQRNNGKAPRYDNRHRNLTNAEEQAFIDEGRKAVIRFKIEDNHSIKWNDLIRGHMHWRGEDLGGDMVIARRASSTNEIGDPLYNLVVVVDDAAMEITHVIRGEDHIANTAKQVLLYEALKLNTPQFAHTPLILNKDGRKLSKRDGVTSINDFKTMGYTPEAMANYMTLLGWSVPESMNERFTIKEAASVFSLGRVNKAGAKFDWDKLNWLNSQVINEWPKEKLLEALKTLWRKEGWELLDDSWGLDLVELISPSMTLLTDGLDQGKPFFEVPKLKTDGEEQLAIDGVRPALNYLLEMLEENPWDGKDKDEANGLIKKITEAKNLKKGLIMKSLRAALLGTLKGPDLITTWGLLARIGQDSRRIRSCL